MTSVGITGHRILVEFDRLTAGVDAALSRIEQAFFGQPLTVLSALASHYRWLRAMGREDAPAYAA